MGARILLSCLVLLGTSLLNSNFSVLVVPTLSKSPGLFVEATDCNDPMRSDCSLVDAERRKLTGTVLEDDHVVLGPSTSTDRTSLNNRFMIRYNTNCLEGENESVLSKRTHINLTDDDQKDADNGNPFRVVKLKKRSIKYPGGHVFLTGGTFQRITTGGSNADEINESPIAGVRTELLRYIANILDVKATLEKVGSMNDESLVNFLDSDTPKLVCKYMHKLRIEHCTVPSLFEAMNKARANFLAGYGGDVEKTAAGILSIMRGMGNHPRFESNQEYMRTAVDCISHIENDDEMQVFANIPPTGEHWGDMMWHLKNEGFATHAEAGWTSLGYGSVNRDDGMVVAVIDTGCSDHQDLHVDAGNSVIYVNPGETDCTNGIDDDGNGYIDDCRGWNFLDDNPDSAHNGGHGTRVAAILASMSGDLSGVPGVYWAGKIMCLKAGGPSLPISCIVEALNYAVDNGAMISNNSYGLKGENASLEAAVTAVGVLGHLFVSAAGNASCNTDDPDCHVIPGAFELDNILNVGGTRYLTGKRGNFSNYGKVNVDVFAPGDKMFSASDKDGCTDCYSRAYGTSLASPVVAGLAAALWTHYRKVTPLGWVQMTQQDGIAEYLLVKRAIMESVQSSTDIAGACVVNGIVKFDNGIPFYDNGRPPVFTPIPDPEGGYVPTAA